VAVWAIGDLQGCLDSFQRLLERIHFDERRDTLWLTGDLVNRGPDSLGTLRFVRALGDCVVTVLGNHDLHLLAVAANDGQGLRPGDTLEDILRAPDRDALLGWLAERPLLHHDPRLRTTLIHAGLPAQWTIEEATAHAREVSAAIASDGRGFYAQMYGNEPDRWSPGLTRTERLRFTVNCLTRLRMVDASGRALFKFKLHPRLAPEKSLPWFAVPGRRSRRTRIVFGHWSTLGLYEGHGVVGLDTGCVWGRELTAYRLDKPSPLGTVPGPASLRSGPPPDEN
jgi:bis(5'-nucleosyl)-tetraphosphatase (symmetrical)